MNTAAQTLFGIPPKGKSRPGQIGVLFVQGRVALQKALRDVHVGGEPVHRPASILPTGRDRLGLTVSITGLDDGFRWVLRPVTATARPSRPHAIRRR
jgi:hypothetical protein